MNIAVFGLGYVGCVSAACLAQQKHYVYGVDVNPAKVDLINAGKSPIVEAHISEIISEAVETGHLKATLNVKEAVEATDVALICVGTPSDIHGGLDLTYIRNVADQIGEELKHKDDFYVIAVRSTMLPGSVEEAVAAHVAQKSGKTLTKDFGVAINPEFLREGSAVADYLNPAFTLIGASDDRTAKILSQIYDGIEAPIITTDIKVAEFEKYVSNAFHALKVTFANEIGIVSQALGIDSHKVMEIFKQDTHLNISEKYLNPGFAFGGSCLPKDVRAIVHRAKHLDLNLPLLDSILPSNKLQVERVLQMVQALGRKKVGFLGLSFKAGTDDLRESPLVTLVELLIGKGYDLKIYDKNVNLARLFGANREFIENAIPHISLLITDQLDTVVRESDILLIGTNEQEFKSVPASLRDDQHLIDLVRITDPENVSNRDRYQGVSW